MFFTPYSLLVIPAILFAAWAQFKVRSTYKKYAQIGVRSGLRGADIAEYMMRSENVTEVALEQVAGEMTDHYDPKSKTVRLSEGVYHGSSIAALGIAAHEVGHVIQHARGYAPLGLRHFMYPVSAVGSKLAVPLIIAGLLFSSRGGGFLLNLGIWFFAASVAFTLITLPVEFNASRRAMRALSSGGYLGEDELLGARKVLSAAAMTYVAAAAVAVLQLVQLLLMRRD